MIHRSSLYMGIIALAVFVTFGCSQQSASKGAQKGSGQRGGQRQAVNVQTATVQRISIQRSVDLSGNLISPDQARVSAEVAGVVREVLIEIGQEVNVGQEMVR